MWFSSSSAEGCLSVQNHGGLFYQAAEAQGAVRLSQGDIGGVAIDESGAAVTRPGVAAGNALDVYGPVAASGPHVIAESAGQSECGIDPPCYGFAGSGLFAARLQGLAVPTGFVESAVRALRIIGGDLHVAADGAAYSSRAGEWEVAVQLDDVFGFVDVPWVPGETVVFARRSPYQFTLPGAAWVGYESPPGPIPDPLVDNFTSAAVPVGDEIVSASASPYGPIGIYRSVYGGSINVFAHCDIASLGVAGPNMLYAGAVTDFWRRPLYRCSPVPPGRVFASTDGGRMWTRDDAGMTARDVFAFTSVGAGAARLDLAGTSAGVFARTPGGPWTPAGLDGRRVLTFYDAPDGLIAGTDDGLFRRDAAGAWTRYGQGLDGRAVYAVLATTDAYGAWIGAGTDVGLFQTRAFGVASEAAAPLPAGVLRVTTLPNPSGGTRTVRVEGLDGEARLSVVDLLGRRVADLGTLVARGGQAEASWDASALPPGVYVVRAVSAQGSAVERAAVVR
ncbi:MAG TPA: T9SS type A sorting domain-containing protein [Rubricoccaceae bacterium]